MSGNLKKPCGNCPFLRGSTFEQSMMYERAEEIADSLRAGSMFPCHKTTTASGASGNDQKFCAGALGTMQNDGTVWDNQMARICGRLGTIEDPAEMEGLDRLYDSLEDWVDTHD